MAWGKGEIERREEQAVRKVKWKSGICLTGFIVLCVPVAHSSRETAGGQFF